MLSYISAKEAAEKWNISQRRVSILCAEGRVEGAMMVGNMWIIPSTSEKPLDKRVSHADALIENSVKPFVKWVGGKGQLLEELQKHLPKENKYTKYAEPMVGGGALFFNVVSMGKFSQFYISDINKELINVYQVIKTNVEELISKLLEMQMSFLPMDENGRRYYYHLVRDKFNKIELNADNKIDKACLFLFLNKTCFNGLYRVNKKGQFNVPMGAYKNPNICDEENLKRVSSVLQSAEIVCGDYKKCFDFVDDKTFVYIDPPYRPISQTSAFTSYNTDTFDDNEQIRLAEFVKSLDKKGAMVMVSNSDPQNVNPTDKFFEDLYGDFKIDKVNAARAINSKGGGRGKIKELLICNYKEENK